MRHKLSMALLITLLATLTAITTGANPSQAGAALNRATGVTYSAAISAGQPMTPVGSGFTYQGRLLDGGNPANGTYDLRFTLFDALSGGNQVGSPLTLSSQTVTNGLFTVTLDFGSTVFRGDARFMQIEVQHNGGGFVVLAPRQPLTPAPYAMSLMPGAVISGTTNNNILVTINNGTGEGLRGNATSNSGVEGDSISGNGVSGFTSSGTAGALSGTNFGTGPGVSANSTSGPGMNATGHSAGVYGVGTDVSAAGVWGVANSGTGAAGLYGTSTSGYGAEGISSAVNGTGVYGVDNNTGSSGVAGNSSFGYGVYGTGSTGVRGETAAGGNGVSGLSPSGNGVIGTSTSGSGVTGASSTGTGVKGQAFASGGTGVEATGSGSSTAALWIDNGSIRVTNAGNETNSPVFVHTVQTGTGGNTCFGDVYSIIDNPYANGDSNAILVVTPSQHFNGGTIPRSVMVAYTDAGFSNCPLNRWVIFSAGGGSMGDLEKYNVVVIKP